MGYRDLSMVNKDDEVKVVPPRRLTQYYDRFEQFKDIKAFREAAKTLKGSRDFGAQLFTALLRACGVETRLVFSLQPLGFGFGKQEDAHRLDRRKDDLDKPISTDGPHEASAKKRKRTRDESDDDLGLPKVKGRGIRRMTELT